LKEALNRWVEASEEVVPLTSSLKVLNVYVDASLSGRASVMVDAGSGAVVASESQLASDVMNLERWAVNRREMCALTSAARKLAQRLVCYPKLRSVVFFTDSKVAEAHAGEYKQPKSASVEAFPLVRLSVAFDNILADLGRAAIVVEVRHIERNPQSPRGRPLKSGGVRRVQGSGLQGQGHGSRLQIYQRHGRSSASTQCGLSGYADGRRLLSEILAPASLGTPSSRARRPGDASALAADSAPRHKGEPSHPRAEGG